MFCQIVDIPTILQLCFCGDDRNVVVAVACLLVVSGHRLGTVGTPFRAPLAGVPLRKDLLNTCPTRAEVLLLETCQILAF